MRWLLALGLVACSTTSLTLRPGHVLTGPREIAAIGGSDLEQWKLEEALSAHGFRLLITHGEPAPARYTVDMSGSCAITGIKVEVFDRKAGGDLAFVARRPSSFFDCPGSIFEDLAVELDRVWTDPVPVFGPEDTVYPAARDAGR